MHEKGKPKTEEPSSTVPYQEEPAFADDFLKLMKENRKKIRMTIQGSSMAPLLRTGDRVTLRPVEYGQLRLGDISAFREGSSTILHRIGMTRKENGRSWFFQAGDNCAAGSWIPEEMVIGRLETVHRSGKIHKMDSIPWRWINFYKGMSVALQTCTPKRKFIPKAIYSIISGINKILNRTINQFIIVIS